MNKKLIALAIAGAFVAPVAMADTGNVKISGQLHVSLDSLDGKNAAGTDLTREWNVSSNASFIQFSGDEDLGNGMKAVWALKTYVSMGGTGNSGDPLNLNASDGFTNGPAYAGISANWGAVLLGKMEAPMKVLGRKADLFGNQIGDIRNFSLGFDNRPNNVIAYASPNMNGFTGTIAYVTNLNVGTKAAATDKSVTAWSASGIYANGPVLVGLGYEKHNLSNAGVAGVQDQKDWRLVGGYNFGDFKLVGMYEKGNDLLGIDGADQKVYGLGGAYKMGSNTIKAQWYKIGDFWNIADTGGNMFALGVDHAMSKRTTVYAAYARTNNDTNSTYSAFGAGHGDNPGTVVGKDPSGLSFGMIHNF